MEPQIQYAKTDDGVSIAYCTHGKGPALVQLWNFGSHIRQQWEVPEFRSHYERLAEKRMLVHYDSRGTGLSQRDVTDLCLETLGLDIEAVVDRLGLERFALWGPLTMGPMAVTYAVRHPERVSRLILWCSYARASDLLKSPQSQALGRLRNNWELYTDTMAYYFFGWAGGEPARRWSATLREGVSQETYQASQAQFLRADVTDLLPQVRAATLVLHRQRFPMLSVDVAAELASRIPNARLVLIEGESSGEAVDNPQAIRDAIDEFLEDEAAEPEPLPSKDVHTILFTDMQSSTALTQRLGDAKAQEVRRAHNTIVRDALKTNDGSEIKHTGDGIMATFTTASSALECAIAIQRGVAAHVEEHPDSPLGLYIGLNAGEPIAEERDLFGTSVDLAKRICDHAEPGQILVADVVRQLAAGKDFLFADLGETELRGFEDPVKLWEVRWRA